MAIYSITVALFVQMYVTIRFEYVSGYLDTVSRNEALRFIGNKNLDCFLEESTLSTLQEDSMLYKQPDRPSQKPVVSGSIATIPLLKPKRKQRFLRLSLFRTRGSCNRVSNPCSGRGTCICSEPHHTCDCIQGYAGNCNTDIDECSSGTAICSSNAFCSNTFGTYTCTCNAGFEGNGITCQDKDECEGTPCKHGSCNDHVNDYSCTCEDGYEGKDCDIDIDECQTSPCQHGSCNDHVNDYSCTCEDGYGGKDCDIDIDECQSTPCQHGSCNDRVNDYSCTCVDGYEGKDCDIDIDECQSSPCQHGSCNDHVNDYSCTCVDGYDGKNCDVDIDECNSSPCLNGATCNDHVNRYTCTCTEDYTDSHCETDMCYPSQGADIAVILDGSTSQSKAVFQRQKEFTKSLVNAFPIDMNDFRFSVVSVSDVATIEFDLETHLTNESLLQAIENIQPLNRSSNIHTAIKAARDDIFTDASITKTKYLIMLGDGLNSSPLETESEAFLTRHFGITLISVGFGDQILQKALIDTANDHNHVFSPITEDLKNWLLKRHVMDTCPDCTSQSSDVFILLESSHDLSNTVFYGLVKSFKSLIEKIPISEDRVHVSVATFDSSVSEKFDFVAHYSQQSIITYIMSTTRRTQQTSNYANALQHIEDNVFVSSNGYREGARKIAILIIADTISDLDTVKGKSDVLKEDDITIVVITFTLESRPNITALLEIASDPAYLFVIGKTVYGGDSALDALTTLLEYTLCIFD